MIVNDTSDYVKLAIDNIQIVLSNYKDYHGCQIIETNDDAFIPRYPALTIEFDSMHEEWKEIPRRKILIMNFSITYYFASLSDKGCRQGLRAGLSKIANVLRENWDINNFTTHLGSTVTSVIPYVLQKGDAIVAGGVITLQCNKVIDVTFA